MFDLAEVANGLRAWVRDVFAAANLDAVMLAHGSAQVVGNWDVDAFILPTRRMTGDIGAGVGEEELGGETVERDSADYTQYCVLSISVHDRTAVGLAAAPDPQRVLKLLQIAIDMVQGVSITLTVDGRDYDITFASEISFTYDEIDTEPEYTLLAEFNYIPT